MITCIKRPKTYKCTTVIKEDNSFEYLQGKNLALQDKTIQY